MEEQTRNMKAVYTVVERGQGKSYWTRVGIGFTNRDGSLNLRLDAIPINGTLQVREWEPPLDRRPDRPAPAVPFGADPPMDGPPRARPKLPPAPPVDSIL
jgi:hypothetical protein